MSSRLEVAAIDRESLLRALLSERIKLLAYIRAIVRRRDLAEDVLQDVCVLALQKQSEIHDERHLAGWLRTTARLRAMSILRRQRVRHQTLNESVLDLIDLTWGELEQGPAPALRDALHECVGRLSRSARQLLTARYTEGRGVAEIAEQLKRPVASVYVTFSRIHNALADCVYSKLKAARGAEGSDVG